MSDEITANSVSLPAQSSELPSGFFDMIDDLKSIVRGAHVRAQLKVNTEMIRMYREIGRTILEKQGEEHWGSKVINRIATELRTEFPGQRGFSRSNLHYMQQMARTWPEQFVQQPVGQLPWGHIIVLMGHCKAQPERDFYAERAVQHGWSRNVLEFQIQSRLHEREGSALSNFAATAPEDSDALQAMVKSPYNLDFTGLDNQAPERSLEDALVERVVLFLTELGVGFAFVGRQFPLRVGESDFRLDLLFYHYKLDRFVVIELKTGRAEPEHFGKLNFYLAVADDLIRNPERHGPTIGLLVAANHDPAVAEYALARSGSPMAVATWTGVDAEAQKALPSAEDLARVADDVLRAQTGAP
ncbi:PDDEXK nuclease domain-containing protein [Streptomyces sp. NBC_01465]|uniref:PDDEXK nuclease domain-containing protein n=1 Tax=Streptomyces sp. NBC_01465 TaxID=2903878 RepID=UPI002E2F9AF5|nr:PDDEXK nuclease domain-containing protein [Streptomyces sp. NBC_01465]